MVHQRLERIGVQPVDARVRALSSSRYWRVPKIRQAADSPALHVPRQDDGHVQSHSDQRRATLTNGPSASLSGGASMTM